MIYPIMEITQFGVDVQSTILQGVISFLEMKSYFIAIVIFTASVVIPLIKLVGLLFIFISLKTDVKMEGNEYYTKIHEQLSKKYGVDKLTAAQMGGLECGKCHY